MKLGVSGNIASGKSEVEKILISMGYKTICADKIVHKLYSVPEVQEKIYEIFNTIDRKEIAPVVFSNKNKKLELENIIHPLVEKEIVEFFSKNKDEKFVFAFVPLLFECNMEKLFDKTIFVSCDENIRLKRVISRDKVSKELAVNKIKSQLLQEEKIKRADFILENNSDIISLKNQVQEVLTKL